MNEQLMEELIEKLDNIAMSIGGPAMAAVIPAEPGWTCWWPNDEGEPGSEPLPGHQSPVIAWGVTSWSDASHIRVIPLGGCEDQPSLLCSPEGAWTSLDGSALAGEFSACGVPGNNVQVALTEKARNDRIARSK